MIFKNKLKFVLLLITILVVTEIAKPVDSKSIKEEKKFKFDELESDECFDGSVNIGIKKISKRLKDMVLKELQNINKNEDESAKMNRKIIQLDLLMKLNKLYDKLKCQKKVLN